MDEHMIDCAFDSIIMSEERLSKQGFDEGYCAGKTIGYEKGFSLGLENGSTVNRELGFYSGFVVMWLQLLSNIDQSISESVPNKTRNVLTALNKMLNEFPRDDPHNDGLQQQLMNIRAKFKQICSLLNISPVFDAGSPRGISF